MGNFILKSYIQLYCLLCIESNYPNSHLCERGGGKFQLNFWSISGTFDSVSKLNTQSVDFSRQVWNYHFRIVLSCDVASRELNQYWLGTTLNSGTLDRIQYINQYPVTSTLPNTYTFNFIKIGTVVELSTLYTLWKKSRLKSTFPHIV